MKKGAVLAGLLAGVIGGTVGAANPFADVSPSDWAYQAVSEFSDEGIVDGYPDGTFRGQKNVTRYELAQIVARLMAKEDEYSTSQRAIIEKLACALADELDNMGCVYPRWNPESAMCAGPAMPVCVWCRGMTGMERKTVPLMAVCASALMQRSMIPPM